MTTSWVDIGLDLGTSSVKLVAVDESMSVCGIERRRTPWRRVDTGREMQPSDLLETVLGALGALAERCDARIRSVGITSMGQTGTLVDESGTTLVPFVAWDDTRTADTATLLQEDIGSDQFTAITGLPIGPSWSLCRLRMLGADPARSTKASRWLGIAEWIAYQLTGEVVAELSLACQSGMVDVRRRAWSDELLTWAGMTRSQLPVISPAAGTAHRSRSDLIDGVVVVAGHDHLVGALGAGAAGSGTVYDSCGTAETIVRYVDEARLEHVAGLVGQAGLMLGWAPDGHHLAVTGSQGTTVALQRVLRALSITVDDVADVAYSPSVEPGALHGDIYDASVPIRAGASSAQAVWSAALSQAAQSARRIVHSLDEVAGRHETAVVAGGWSRHRPFVDSRADVFRSFEVVSIEEPGAYGAAITALPERSG